MNKTATPEPRKAGRPVSTNPSSHYAHIRLTEGQYLKYMELGGARWIKRLIDEQSTKDAK